MSQSTHQPFVPSEKGYDQTDVPSEHANEGELPLPTDAETDEDGKTVPKQ